MARSSKTAPAKTSVRVTLRGNVSSVNKLRGVSSTPASTSMSLRLRGSSADLKKVMSSVVKLTPEGGGIKMHLRGRASTDDVRNSSEHGVVPTMRSASLILRGRAPAVMGVVKQIDQLGLADVKVRSMTTNLSPRR